MLEILQSDIFDSPAQTLVNTVNTVGVMGKGIAADFKNRFPEMFTEYKAICNQHQLEVGTLHFWRGPTRCVLNFPTKTTWRQPSKLDYVRRGLETFVKNYKQLGITSASFPPLGCGNGQLDWKIVRPMMVGYLKDADIPIFIHEGYRSRNQTLEHAESAARVPPLTMQEFLNDLHSVIAGAHGVFQTSRGQSYVAKFVENQLIAEIAGRQVVLDDFVELAWVGLKVGMVYEESFGDKSTKAGVSVLMPLLSAMPYIRSVKVGDPANPRSRSETALFFDEGSTRSSEPQRVSVGPRQECLSL